MLRLFSHCHFIMQWPSKLFFSPTIMLINGFCFRSFCIHGAMTELALDGALSLTLISFNALCIHYTVAELSPESSFQFSTPLSFPWTPVKFKRYSFIHARAPLVTACNSRCRHGSSVYSQWSLVAPILTRSPAISRLITRSFLQLIP